MWKSLYVMFWGVFIAAGVIYVTGEDFSAMNLFLMGWVGGAFYCGILS